MKLLAAVLLLFCATCAAPATMTKAPKCEGPETIRTYQGNRIKLWVSPKYTEQQRMALMAAISAFPCDIFSPSKDRETADLILEPDTGQKPCPGSSMKMEPELHAGAYFRCVAGTNTILTSQKATRSVAGWYALFLHELGHALGFDDTDYGTDKNGITSIMEHDVLSAPFGVMADGHISPRFRKDQVMSIVKDYCPR